jgi:hypothetical protein
MQESVNQKALLGNNNNNCVTIKIYDVTFFNS